MGNAQPAEKAARPPFRIDYYLKPDVSRLFVDKVDEVTGEVSSAASVWIQAVTQTLFAINQILP
ncbi:hypothetical protein T484DRAFT_1784493 [Baffinella frigidus]|nr:hypothetical protein T484DRAFT_1784493 [Cryptophyta sp. CCMP2293]